MIISKEWPIFTADLNNRGSYDHNKTDLERNARACVLLFLIMKDRSSSAAFKIIKTKHAHN